MKFRRLLFFTTLLLVLWVSVASLAAEQTHHKKGDAGQENISLRFDTPAHYPFSGKGCEIKATSLCSHLTPTIHLYRTQKTFCLFEIFFEAKPSEKYLPPLPVALHSFYQNLFCSIISPNAP